MKNKRVAVYPRYSTAKQNPKSVKDQIRECREAIERQGGIVVGIYPDHAVGGDSLKKRHKYNEMIEDLKKRKFDVIFSESLSRLSRDPEEANRLYKLARYYNCDIITISEGLIDEVKIAVMSAMNSMFLKNNADQVKRTLIGRVKNRKWVGRPPYGFSMDKSQRDESGEIIRGLLKKNPEEAVIIERIFEEYDAGKSPRQIAMDLNKDGISGPRGQEWRGSVIRGDRRAQTGILNNELYIGNLVWNKVRYEKDPETEIKTRHIKPESEWVRSEVPEYRIIGDNLWKAVKAKQDQIHENGKKSCPKNSIAGCRRAKYIFSGKIYCAECGNKYGIVRPGEYGCIGRKSGRLCTNDRRVERLAIEKAALRGITEILLCPEMLDYFEKGFTTQYKDVRDHHNREQMILQKEIKDREERLKNLNDVIETGRATQMTVERALELEAEIIEKKSKVTFDPGVPELNQDIIAKYRDKVLDICSSLYEDEIKYPAMQAIRPLIEKIVLTPDGEGLKAHIYGNIADLLNIDEDRLAFFC